MENIPSWLKKVLSKDSFDHVEEAIQSVEKITSAEIVPVVIQRSSTVGHVPLLLLFASFALGYMAIDLLSLEWDLLWLVLGNLIFALLITRILSPLSLFERWLTPKDDQRHQVVQRAEMEFYESQIQKTQDATGILMFVSLMERQVVVLADKAISEKFPEDTWSHVVTKITQGIKEKDLGQGLCNGIESCGELLKDAFPFQPDDTNELPNHLIIKEF